MAFFNKRLGFGNTPEDLYAKPKPKKFNYSSEANGLILDQALSDVAELSESTMSNVIENILIDELLPENKDARRYVCGVYLGKVFLFGGGSERYGVQEALRDIFSSESAGIGSKAAHGGCKELVELACDLLQSNKSTMRLELFNGKIKGSNPKYHLLSSWDSVGNKIEHEATANIGEGLVNFEMQEAAKWVREYERAMEKDPSFFYFNSVRFILQNWQVLGNYTYTYRFLMDVMESVNAWNETAEDRTRFKEMCDLVMSGWAASREKERERERKAEIDAILTTYDLADGAVVRAPQSWVVANPEDGISSRFAGVIEIKNGERFDAPHFLFFLREHPVNQMTVEERLSILRDASNKWPRLREVQENEIELQYGPDGGILNQKEWMAAPAIGMFSILDEGEHPLGRPPYGAVVVRAGRGSGSSAVN